MYVPGQRVYTAADFSTVDDRNLYKESPSERLNKGFENADKCIDNTFNAKLIDKINAPLKFCVDKSASCSKASFCNSASTDSVIEVSASVSKSVSYGSVGLSVISLKHICKAFIELGKFFTRCEFKKNPDGTFTIVKVHDRPYLAPDFSDTSSDSSD